MKNAQNEFEKSAEKSLSVTTIANSLVEQQITPTLSSTSTASPIENSIENAENVQNNNATAASAAETTTAHAAKMTEELNNDNNNENNSTSSVNNNNSGADSSIIAEAAKILLKNGINGTSAAAAALLAAQSLQLPAFSLTSIPTTTSPESLSRVTSEIVGNSLLEPPPAHVASTSKMSTATISTTLAIGHSPQRSNGLPSPSHFKANVKDSYNVAASTSGVNLMRKSLTTLDTTGAIDCSFGTPANAAQKSTSAPGIGSANMSGGHTHGGGRLQFFKDGKFILELARSKDSERGGWVSVPRKQFRSPSATSSTVTPSSTANTCMYPKIESSTSFSFSDDNSSIQSSPWQRDHCWKQATPKRNISKEMLVYYQAPKGATLTSEGLRLAKLKRRRPFDNTKNDIKAIKIFDFSSDGQSVTAQKQMQNGKADKLAIAATNTNEEDEDDRCSTSSAATLIGDNEDNVVKETEKVVRKEKTALKSAAASISDNVMEKTKTTATTKNVINEEIADNNNKMDETTTCGSDVEKMNTSEDGEDDRIMLSQEVLSSASKNKAPSPKKTIDVIDAVKQRQRRPLTTTTPPPPPAVKSKTGVEDKRLIKKKIVRAKLTTIVQKLIDQMPTRVSSLLLKTPTLSNCAGAQHISNSLSNKVSPTSSSSTSPSLILSSSSACSVTVGTASSHRLVEYHQQHVSPRKRILREFERVSLDDNATVIGAGGKRSRAKSCANAAMTTNYHNLRSPNNRVHSSVCNVPTASSLSTTTTSNSTTNGESQIVVTKVNKNATTASAANVPPTRLYSSYSIHSLLGDNTSSNSKKSTEHTAAYNQPQSEHLQTLYMRNSISPKSPPEAVGGGKSPSNTAHKKRSPPYASPLREAHSRSPTVNNNLERSPRATPTDFKQRYGAPGLLEHQTLHAHHSHQQQQHHRQLQQQQQLQQGAFYSPYMMSSKYVPVSSGITTAGAASPPSTSRSPRHSINNSFSSCSTTQTNATITTTSHHNIPNSQQTISHNRDVSPTRSLEGSSRDVTPRTVPKKTASIRRQFASPTSSSSSHSHSQNTTSNSCPPSPGERGGGSDECVLMDSKSTNAAAAAAAAAAYQQMFQRQSSNAAASSLASPLHTAAYYMYPPAAPLPFNSNGGANSTGGASSSPHTASSTSPYIPTLMPPSYYHSYISALNITKHYYMGAGASPQSAAAAAAARLSPQFHHLGIPYNGVSAAAMAAAAAAAAFTGQHGPLPHHSMLPPPSAAATAAALYGVGGLSGLGNLSSSALSVAGNTSSSLQNSAESNLTAFIETSSLSNNSSSVGAPSMRSTSATAQHSHNIKDEQSSDVPLNLSKH